jgi:hypothetical protein
VLQLADDTAVGPFIVPDVATGPFVCARCGNRDIRVEFGSFDDDIYVRVYCHNCRNNLMLKVEEAPLGDS